MSPLPESTPSPCATCPRVIELNAGISRIEVQKELVTHVVTSGAYDAMTAQVSELMQQLPADFFGDDVDPSDTESIAVSSRRMAASALDQFDEDIAKKQQAIESLTDSCDQPLKMRAQKAGTVYLATICTAKIIRSTHGGSEPARVTRTSAE